MSVQMISTASMNTLVSAMVQMNFVSGLEANSVIAMIQVVNVASWNQRYNQNDSVEPVTFKETDRVINSADGGDIYSVQDLISTVKLCDYVSYQLDEAPNSEQTLIVKTLNAFNEYLLDLYLTEMDNTYPEYDARSLSKYSLPGYDAAPWGL